MRFLLKAALILVACCAVFAPRGSSAADNWMRDYVENRVAEQISRSAGDEAASQFLRWKTGRIVGGTIAPASLWPQQVALLRAGASTSLNLQFCAGTLIHARFVVTAAHCSDFVTAAQVRVLTGTKSLYTGGVRRMVKRIRVHPNWNPNTFANDVAVWELTAAVPGITPAAMILPSQETALTAAADDAWVTGWGTLYHGGPSSGFLRQAVVPMIARSVCNGPGSYRGAIFASMVCAGKLDGSVDACQGDSGGPLWVRNASSQYIVAGITSWGNGCGIPNFPGVYTRLAVFSGWVRNVILSAN